MSCHNGVEMAINTGLSRESSWVGNQTCFATWGIVSCSGGPSSCHSPAPGLRLPHRVTIMRLYWTSFILSICSDSLILWQSCFSAGNLLFHHRTETPPSCCHNAPLLDIFHHVTAETPSLCHHHAPLLKILNPVAVLLLYWNSFILSQTQFYTRSPLSCQHVQFKMSLYFVWVSVNNFTWWKHFNKLSKPAILFNLHTCFGWRQSHLWGKVYCLMTELSHFTTSITQQLCVLFDSTQQHWSWIYSNAVMFLKSYPTQNTCVFLLLAHNHVRKNGIK